MTGPSKTNAARILDRAKVAYQLIPYPFDPDDLAAQHVAQALGEDIAQVFKTLVMRGERHGLLVCVIPGDKEVDLKKAAHAAGEKKVEMVAVKELLPLTGYIRGGCSPIGMKKALPTLVHLTAMDHPWVYVSAGQRGLQLKLSPHDLVNVCRATVADLTNE